MTVAAWQFCELDARLSGNGRGRFRSLHTHDRSDAMLPTAAVRRDTIAYPEHRAVQSRKGASMPWDRSETCDDATCQYFALNLAVEFKSTVCGVQSEQAR